MFDPAFGLTLWKTLAEALVVACLLAGFTRRWQLAAIIALLLVDWAICTVTPDLSYGREVVWNWIACGLVDTIIGAIIVTLFWQHVIAMAIGFVLLCEVGAHLAFGADHLLNGAPGHAVVSLYWQITHWGAWIQAWLLVFWMVHHGLEMAGLANVSDSIRRLRRSVRAEGHHACAEDAE